MIFKTSYSYGNQALASYVKADSQDKAASLLERRGLGEIFNDKVPKQKRFSANKLFKDGKLLDCLHWVTFGSRTILFSYPSYWCMEDFLEDNGIIHRLIHEIMRLDYPVTYEKKYKKFLDKERQELTRDLKTFDMFMEKLGY